ncbi:MAG: zinc-dependent metalloprotease [Bdellovibrionaceae bacterium]|nr:zinc-dependent metalloprotease [Pseudobdellovibrionaceae bacterium]
MNEILFVKRLAMDGQLASSFLVIILVGCTKTIPPKEVTKLETTDKNSVSIGVDYILAASQGQGSRTSPDSFPYFFGENKRVQLRFTKEALIIEEKEKDARFVGNSTNDKTVLQIPVEHLDYRCAQDRFGECTGQEEVNTDIPWEKKGFFKLKAENFKAAQIEALPMAGDPCYEEVSSQVVGVPEISPEAINFEIEKTFVESCAARDLSETNVKARYHYSLVRADTVLTPGFLTVNYPETDQSKFGFFSTERYERDTDLSETASGKKTIMNHWSPDRTRLDFHLSDEFAKPENALIKDLTYKTVANLNLGLSKAGAKFRMHLHEPSGKKPGDIRNSMIVLVEDPLASSIIGYGPQTEDPKTGEIFSARTTMFLGTIKSFIKYTYEDIVRAKRAQALAKVSGTSTGSSGDGASGGDQGNHVERTHVEFEKALNISEGRMSKASQAPSSEAFLSSVINASRVASPLTLAEDKVSPVLVKNQMSRLFVDPARETDQAIQAQFVGHEASNIIPNYIEVSEATTPAVSGVKKAALQRLNYLNNVKNCAFSPPYGQLSHSFELKLAELLPGGAEELKPWEKLSAAEKEKVIEVLLPDVWVGTLIHELGHNLGLRHNFEASEDGANFYSAEQIQALNAEVGVSGYAQQNQAHANSVMEYIDDLKALKHLGAYDIEALKFTYNKAGYESSLSEGKAEKEFRFCTDENVGVSPGCRRHDVGVTMVEIVTNLIESYHAAYEYRNFRRDRADFSLIGDIAYASRIGQVFSEIRLMLEAVERITNRGYSYSDERWLTNKYLADLRAAAKMGGEFFLKVISIPDKVCYFESLDPLRPGLIPKPLRAFGMPTCESVNPKEYEGFESTQLYAQSGRLFNSVRDPNSSNYYADQIDVRGYWLDQMMAVRYLLYRQVGNSSLDKEGDNYLDLPELRGPILKTLTELSLNKLRAPTEVEFVDGSKMTLPLSVDSIWMRRVEKPIHPIVARRLGVPNRPFYLTEYFNQFIAHQLTNFTDKESLEKMTAELFKVAVFDNRTANLKGTVGSNQKYLDVGTQRFVAAPENAIAQELIRSAEEFRTQIVLVKSLGNDVIKKAVEMLTEAEIVTLPLDQKIVQMEKLASQLNLTAPNRKNLRQLAGLPNARIADLADQGLLTKLATESEAELLNQDSNVELLRMLPNSVAN